MTSKEIKELEKKIDKLQETVERLENKLNKHIDFIDDTYECARKPNNALTTYSICPEVPEICESERVCLRLVSA